MAAFTAASSSPRAASSKITRRSAFALDAKFSASSRFLLISASVDSAFRHNTRDIEDHERVTEALRGIGEKCLTYRRVGSKQAGAAPLHYLMLAMMPLIASFHTFMMLEML